MKPTINELEALKHAAHSIDANLTVMPVSCEDKRLKIKYVLIDVWCKSRYSPQLHFNELNLFILGFAKAVRTYP